jgi:hypothetical protein
MLGMLLSVLILTLSAGSTGWAQSAPVESDDSRYTFNQVDEGYLRLDGRTGQVSICTRRTVGWACQAVADERTALEAEIARLQAENVVLKKELLTEGQIDREENLGVCTAFWLLRSAGRDQLHGWSGRTRTRKCRLKICYLKCPPNSLYLRNIFVPETFRAVRRSTPRSNPPGSPHSIRKTVF